MENGGLDFHCPYDVGFKCLVSASKSSREWLSVSAQAQDKQLATSPRWKKCPCKTKKKKSNKDMALFKSLPTSFASTVVPSGELT